MSLALRLSALTTRLGTEFKSIRTTIGDLATLTTTSKVSTVSAINEVRALAVSAAGGGVAINDTAPSTSTTYSGTKVEARITAAVSALVDGAPGALDTLNELAAAMADDAAFTTTVTTALAARVRTDVNTQGLSTVQQGNARTNIDAAATGHGHALDSASLTGILPIAKGGTGAATAAAALAALSGVSTAAIGDPEQDLVAVFNAALL